MSIEYANAVQRFKFMRTNIFSTLIFVLFGSPAAVASYIMAKNMKSDGELAGQILLLTSMLCPITLFSGIFVMKSIGWL